MLSLIAALARNRTVGINNALPWHLPDDLKYFKATTSGHPVIMGRKTFDSIGRPLPNRHNIVITRNNDWTAEGVTVVNSLEDAVRVAGLAAEVFVIGGATLYREALEKADRLYLTEIDADFEGDAHFPEIPAHAFIEIKRESRQSENFAYHFVVYERQK